MIPPILSSCGKAFLFILAFFSTFISKDVFWFFHWWSRRSDNSRRLRKISQREGMVIERPINNTIEGKQNEQKSSETSSSTTRVTSSESITPKSPTTKKRSVLSQSQSKLNTLETSKSPKTLNSSPNLASKKDLFGKTDEVFRKACEFMEMKEFESIISLIPDAEKLAFYGSFKQATHGSCDTPQPPVTDFIERAKWNAWNQLGNTKKEEAKKYYIQQLLRLKRKWAQDPSKQSVVEHLSFLN